MKQGWEEKTLGEISIIKGGKRVPKGYHFESSSTNYPYIRVTDFNDNGSVDLSDIHYISPDVYDQIKNYTITSKDLYISIAGTIGKTGIIPKSLEGSNLTENACKLVFKENIDVKFIYYFTKSQSFISQAGINTRTSAMPKLALLRLSTISLLLPKSISEQKRIVAILDEAFAAIDQAKANAQQNLKNAKELFESYLQSVFENGKLKIENGEWEEKTLPQISVNLDSKRVPITKHIRNKGKIPYYGATGIVDYVENYLFNEKLVLIGEDGAKWNSGDRSAFIIQGKTWVNNHAHVLRPDRNIVSDEWLVYNLNHQDLMPYISGMTVPKLNQGRMNEITIPLPTLPEQKRIVQKLDALSEETKKLEAIYQKKIADLEELKKSILEKAFKGQL